METKPVVGRMIALPLVANTWKLRLFFGKMATDRQHVKPESLVLELTRLREFLIERVTSFSLAVLIPIGKKIRERYKL